MNPVIGLDVVKGGKPGPSLFTKKTYKQSFKVTHHLQGLKAFYQFYQEVEQIAGQPPAVI
ncbi:hypothetical protein GCM10007063_33340 [Lentibacillus kapialis]|uniref:IS110 family transposase n=1 Tax=Lentibacillus kapialis TaxID=340214 RepID=A0A917V1C1_9BACI|nr:hypothetical protein GCM10007063_33340 [Lentibacillus kapialis]